MELSEGYDEEKISRLCCSVRELCRKREFDACCCEIRRAMSEYPDAAAPHNLYGVVLEMRGDHLKAMKHFRAAWALDPTYSPVNQNLETYGTFCSCEKPAFDESDVIHRTHGREEFDIVYDEHRIGHVVRRNRKGF